jgi:hypothetical protein
MNETEARARFLKASQQFQYTVIQLRPQVLFSREPGPLGHLGNLLESIAPQSRFDVVGPRFTLKHADDGLVACHDVLYALANKTTSAIELLKYADAMDASTAELTRVIAEELRNSARVYAPFTAAFKAAAKTLKEAKKKVEDLTNNLNLAADVIGAFSKLVAVL